MIICTACFQVIKAKNNCNKQATQTRRSLMKFVKYYTWILLFFAFGTTAVALEFPGTSPGDAKTSRRHSLSGGERIALFNDVISVQWRLFEERLILEEIKDLLNEKDYPLSENEWFQLALPDGTIIPASAFSIIQEPRFRHLKPMEDSPVIAERFAGEELSMIFLNKDIDMNLTLKIQLRNESNYLRLFYTVQLMSDPVEILSWSGINLKLTGFSKMGEVDGSPLMGDDLFMALEHPFASNQIDPEEGTVFCKLEQRQIMVAGQPMHCSVALGVMPAGQHRRGFQYYLGRERAHAFRSFLNYNTWFDIAYPGYKMNEEECIDAINSVGKELTLKRNITLDTYVIDDGWDDNETIWQFHEDFPRGFKPLQKATDFYGSRVGVWISPSGGNGEDRKTRLRYGTTQGFEVKEYGYSLSGPKYYTRFRQMCYKLMNEYGVNYFKWEGLGTENDVSGAPPELKEDIQALLVLAREVRDHKPEVFINLTSGTWPSPFWLYYGDSVWRSGLDWGAAGEGSERQQWLTYRDSQTYANVVQRAPYFPLNSLMVQGINIAAHGYDPLVLEGNPQDLSDEIWTYFGLGANIQELYITPDMFNDDLWDVLESAINWSHEQTSVFEDTHWIGGDPAAGEVYGWASWTPEKSVIVIRNPSDKAQRFMLQARDLLELPADALRNFYVTSPILDTPDLYPPAITADIPADIVLPPFQVMVLDLVPFSD